MTHTGIVKTAQLVAIATSVALAIPVSVAVISGAPVQFIPAIGLELSLTDVADAIWGYPGRSLGGIDALTFGIRERLVQVLADHTNKEVSHDLAGQPVIEAVSDPIPDLTNKIDSTAQALGQLNLDYQKMTSEVGLMALKWDNLPAADVIGPVDELISALETNNQLTELNKAWRWPELSTVVSLAAQAKQNLDNVRQTASTTGLQPTAYLQLKSALKNLENIQKLIGESSDTAKDKTAYGQYMLAKKSAAAWDGQQQRLTDILSTWNNISLNERQAKVSAAATAVLSLNKIKHADRLLDKNAQTEIWGLIALVDINKKLLAQDAGRAVVGTWLEENPLVIRTLIVNPSTSPSLKVAVKYYLPAEIKEQDILASDPGLEMKWDAQKGRYAVTGDLDLAAADTKTVNVQIADVWGLSRVEPSQNQMLTPQQKIGVLRQAAQTATSTENTAVLGRAANSSNGRGLLATAVVAVVLGGLLWIFPFFSSNRRTPTMYHFQAFSSEDIATSDM